MRGPRDDLATLVATLDAELSWLPAAGFTETSRTITPPSAQLAFSGPHALLDIHLDATSGALVRLAPPSDGAPEWVTLGGVLGAYRLPGARNASFGSKLGLTPGGARQILTPYLRSLHGLRTTVLAGDWSLHEHARPRPPLGDQYLAFLRQELADLLGEPVASERGRGSVTVAFSSSRGRAGVTVDWRAGRLTAIVAPPGDGAIDRRRMRVTTALDVALDLAPPLTAERLAAVRTCLAGLRLGE